jgi:hypothetical protein
VLFGVYGVEIGDFEGVFINFKGVFVDSGVEFSDSGVGFVDSEGEFGVCGQSFGPRKLGLSRFSLAIICVWEEG